MQSYFKKFQDKILIITVVFQKMASLGKYPAICEEIQDLSDKNKNVRKSALIRLKKDVFHNKEHLKNETKEFLDSNFFSKIVARLGDENERIREISAGFILQLLDDFKDYLLDTFFFNTIQIIFDRFSEGIIQITIIC